MDYLNLPTSVVNLAQGNIDNGKKEFANASDYLETWDDSDSIMVVNAQKDLRQPTKMVPWPLSITISRF